MGARARRIRGARARRSPASFAARWLSTSCPGRPPAGGARRRRRRHPLRRSVRDTHARGRSHRRGRDGRIIDVDVGPRGRAPRVLRRAAIPNYEPFLAQPTSSSRWPWSSETAWCRCALCHHFAAPMQRRVGAAASCSCRRAPVSSARGTWSPTVRPRPSTWSWPRRSGPSCTPAASTSLGSVLGVDRHAVAPPDPARPGPACRAPMTRPIPGAATAEARRGGGASPTWRTARPAPSAEDDARGRRAPRRHVPQRRRPDDDSSSAAASMGRIRRRCEQSCCATARSRCGRPPIRCPAGELLLRTLGTAICASDVHFMDHHDAVPAAARPGMVYDPDRDIVLGHEFVGEVIAHGPGCTDQFPVGTRVTAMPILLVDGGLGGTQGDRPAPRGPGQLRRAARGVRDDGAGRARRRVRRRRRRSSTRSRSASSTSAARRSSPARSRS